MAVVEEGIGCTQHGNPDEHENYDFICPGDGGAEKVAADDIGKVQNAHQPHKDKAYPFENIGDCFHGPAMPPLYRGKCSWQDVCTSCQELCALNLYGLITRNSQGW